MFVFKPSGVCSKQISFRIENRKIKNLNFIGGCDGNLKGIASLCEGMDIDNAIERLSGITCGFKSTSCPDQLAKALVHFKESSFENMGA